MKNSIHFIQLFINRFRAISLPINRKIYCFKFPSRANIIKRYYCGIEKKKFSAEKHQTKISEIA